MRDIGPHTPIREVAFIVGDAIHRAKIDAVLTGGGAATVYAPEAYQSRDLDFVLGFWAESGEAQGHCLLELGFIQDGGGYRHASSPFTVEFLRGPLKIGDETLTDWNTLEEGGRVLNIITPTDCVRDRLSWFLFYRRVDRSALEAALGVARNYPIDLDAIERWAVAEGAADRFKTFRRRYELERSSP